MSNKKTERNLYHGFTKQQIENGKIRLAFRKRQVDKIRVIKGEGGDTSDGHHGK